MVLSGKTSRNASLINRTNTEGGVKKAGTASSVGVPASVGWVYKRILGCQSLCNFTVSKVGTCGGGIGRVGPNPRC